MTAPETLDDLLDSITQREWLHITRALEARKDDVQEDSALFMPAVCYMNRLRRDGKADWETVLDLTDQQLADEIKHLLPEDAVEVEQGKAPSTPTGSPSPSTPENSTESGDSTAPDSVSPPESNRPPMTT